jgi:hypothetical protein
MTLPWAPTSAVLIIVALVWIATILERIVREIVALRAEVQTAQQRALAIHQLLLTVRNQYFPLKY